MTRQKVEGLDVVLRKLKELPEKVRRGAARRATGKGAAIIRKRAKDNALRLDDPETGRRIADNIAQRFRGRYSRRTGDVMISVGVLSDRGRIPKGNPDEGRGGNTPHWHLKELGTAKAAADPFLRPAAESSQEEAFNAVADNLGTQVFKELEKIR